VGEGVIVLGALVLAFAAVIGGATGFGAALASMPFLLLLGMSVPEIVTVNLAVTVVTRAVVVVRFRRDMVRWRVVLLCAASVPGGWLGAVTITAVPMVATKILAGAAIVVLGLLLALKRTGDQPLPARTSVTVAGFIGGYLGTTTSLNGALPAILLTREQTPARTMIADLAGFLVVSNVLSLLILAARHELATTVLWPALPIWTVAALAGNTLGNWIGPRLPALAFRRTVLAVIIAAGLVTVGAAIPW
jgi:hypothetical protein